MDIQFAQALWQRAVETATAEGAAAEAKQRNADAMLLAEVDYLIPDVFDRQYLRVEEHHPSRLIYHCAGMAPIRININGSKPLQVLKYQCLMYSSVGCPSWGYGVLDMHAAIAGAYFEENIRLPQIEQERREREAGELEAAKHYSRVFLESAESFLAADLLPQAQVVALLAIAAAIMEKE